MIMLKRMFLALVVAAFAAPMAQALEPRQMVGAWSGSYDYSGNAPGTSSAVEFSVNFSSANGTKLIGRGGEVTGGALQLAEWRGHLRGDVFSFTKIYQGSWTHMVFYEGRVSEDGRTITGRWRINQMTGPFELRRR